MWLLLKNDKEINIIISKNKDSQIDLIKVSQFKEMPLWYEKQSFNSKYEKISEKIKNYIKFLRMHNSWEWYYFWKKEFKSQIINNYGKYTFMKNWHAWYIVEWSLKLNRHLNISEIFRSRIISNFIHNFPPSIFKWLLIAYIVNKFKLDSYEIWWMRNTETRIWNLFHNINAVEDGDYIVFRDKFNFKILSILENIND